MLSPTSGLKAVSTKSRTTDSVLGSCSLAAYKEPVNEELKKAIGGGRLKVYLFELRFHERRSSRE